MTDSTASFLRDQTKGMYQPWKEETFRADEAFLTMTPVQRWMYRTLLQAAFICKERPYLPVDDSRLWVLAGCESLQQWQDNRAAVLAPFERVEIDGQQRFAHPEALEDWVRMQKMLAAKRNAGRAGGRAGAATRERNADGTFVGGNQSEDEPSDGDKTEHNITNSTVRNRVLGLCLDARDVTPMFTTNSLADSKHCLDAAVAAEDADALGEAQSLQGGSTFSSSAAERIGLVPDEPSGRFRSVASSEESKSSPRQEENGNTNTVPAAQRTNKASEVNARYIIGRLTGLFEEVRTAASGDSREWEAWLSSRGFDDDYPTFPGDAKFKYNVEHLDAVIELCRKRGLAAVLQLWLRFLIVADHWVDSNEETVRSWLLKDFVEQADVLAALQARTPVAAD